MYGHPLPLGAWYGGRYVSIRLEPEKVASEVIDETAKSNKANKPVCAENIPEE